MYLHLFKLSIHPLRRVPGLEFGAVLPRYDVSFEEVSRLAIELEELGFHSVWVTDHLQPSRAVSVLESWTVLTAVATLTKRVRLGTVVLCYSYRHPSLLAKMAATLDNVSGGRLELGLGSGSPPQEAEHESLGIYYPRRKGERFRQFEEYVYVVKLLLTCSGRVSYSGKYYSLVDASCNTPPAQKPHPPIWIGARRRRALRIAVEKGDGWNFYGESIEEYRSAVEYVERLCNEVGRASRELRRSIFTTLLIYRDESEKTQILRDLHVTGDEGEFYRSSFTLVHGDVNGCRRMLDTLEQLGVGLVIMRDLTKDARGLRLFAEEILPSY